MIIALLLLAVALAASAWTTAYAWTDTIPSLLWLHRVRREDAWLDSVEALRAQLDVVLVLDAELLELA